MLKILVIAVLLLGTCSPVGPKRDLAAVPLIELVARPVAVIPKACATQVHSIHANSAGDRLLVTCQEMKEPVGATHVTEWLYEIPGGRLLDSVQAVDNDPAVLREELALLERFEPWTNGVGITDCASRQLRTLCQFQPGFIVRLGTSEAVYAGPSYEVARLVDPDHALLAIASFAGPCRREIISWNTQDRTVLRKMVSDCEYDRQPARLVRTRDGEVELRLSTAKMALPPHQELATRLTDAGGAAAENLSNSCLERTVAQQGFLSWRRPPPKTFTPYFWNNGFRQSVDDWNRFYGFLPEVPAGFRILVGEPLELGPQYATAYGPIYQWREPASVSDHDALLRRYWIFSGDGRVAFAQGRAAKVVPLASRRPLVALIEGSASLKVYDLASLDGSRSILAGRD